MESYEPNDKLKNMKDLLASLSSGTEINYLNEVTIQRKPETLPNHP